LIHLPVKEDVSTIVAESTSSCLSKLSDSLREYSTSWFTKMRITPFEKSDDFPVYGTQKASANGPMALGITALRDFVAIQDQGLLPLIKEIGPLVYETYDKLQYILEDTELEIDQSILENRDSYKTGRLHFISEPAGKTRVVAIPDIWSQCVLKPIHNYLMSCLKKLPFDGTFDQASFADKIRGVTSKEGMFCYDLRAATDRLPLKVQVEVLRPLLGDLVDLWASLVGERDFTFKGNRYRYAVGQPMGLLSSWPAMALTHHILINYAKRDESPYGVLGDDMAMSSQEGSKRYLNLMSDLGVEISHEKSINPIIEDHDGKPHRIQVAEIAKRIFKNGHEISRIPPRVLAHSTKDLGSFIEFCEVLATRTNQFGSEDGLELLKSTKRIFFKNREAYSSKTISSLTTPLCQRFLFTEAMDRVRALLLDQEVTPSLWGGGSETYIEFLFVNYLEEVAKSEVFARYNSKMLFGGNPIVWKDLGEDCDRTDSDAPTYILRDYLISVRGRITDCIVSMNEKKNQRMLSSDFLEILLEHPDPFASKDFMTKREIRRERTMELFHKFRLWLVENNHIELCEHDIRSHKTDCFRRDET